MERYPRLCRQLAAAAIPAGPDLRADRKRRSGPRAADCPPRRRHAGLGAVSYTHLDVYKRQVQGITITEIFENEREHLRDEFENLFRPQRPSPRNTGGQPKAIRIVLAILFLIIALLILIKTFSD